MVGAKERDGGNRVHSKKTNEALRREMALVAMTGTPVRSVEDLRRVYQGVRVSQAGA